MNKRKINKPPPPPAFPPMRIYNEGKGPGRYITIDNFNITKGEEIDYIEWDEIKRVLEDKEYKKFIKWMNGQTCIEKGAYVCDVANFLRKPENRFFD
jgi:hypothetical protein